MKKFSQQVKKNGINIFMRYRGDSTLTITFLKPNDVPISFILNNLDNKDDYTHVFNFTQTWAAHQLKEIISPLLTRITNDKHVGMDIGGAIIIVKERYENG